MDNISLKSLLTEVLDWKEIPEEERLEANRLVDEHNKKGSIDPSIKGYYALDVTGKHQVYYTFWRYREDIPAQVAQFIKNPIYFGNLSTNLLDSVKKAIDRTPPTAKLQIWTDGTRHHLIGKPERFTFGKYRGEPYYEVYQKDPAYFAWLAKNQDPKYANTKSAMAIRVFADLYFEEVTKKNVAESPSKFVGTPGGSYVGELRVYGVTQKEGRAFHPGDKAEPYTVYKLIDQDENKFIAFNLEKFFPNIQKEDIIKIKAKVKDHKELMGIKFTALNYVRPA